MTQNPEAQKQKVLSKEEQQHIGAELTRYIAEHKVQVATNEDLETFKKEKDKPENEENKYSRRFLLKHYSDWEKCKAAEGYVDTEKGIFYFKGSDEQLYASQLDLSKIDIDGRKYSNYHDLEKDLFQYSPFNKQDIYGAVEKLREISEKRKNATTETLREKTNADLLKQFNI